MFKKLATAFIITLSGFTATPAAYAAPKVGIIQLIEHPALDRTRQGIIDTLKAKGIDPKDIVWESAQGNAALSTQIAQKFAGQEVKVMVAIATIAAQSALAQAKGIDVVFASVTDPRGAKLVGNITGVSNFVEPSRHFAAMKKRYPNAKTIGVIYNAGEPNSASLVEPMKQAAKAVGLEYVEATASRTSEVVQAAQSLMGKADVIFINNDSTALAGFDAIVKVATSNKIPVFASDQDVFEKGADAVLGPDQYEIGCQAGAMVAEIVLNGKKASDIPIEYPKSVEQKNR